MNNTIHILILAVFYLLILLVLGTARRLRPGLISYQDPGRADLDILSVIHMVLVCVMLLPVWFISSAPFFLLKFSMRPSDEQLFGLWLCLILIIGWPRKREHDLQQHSDTGVLTRQRIVIYAVSRIMFLIVYEWFFRGLLLITSCEMFGTVNAVVINVLLYMLAHFTKTEKR